MQGKKSYNINLDPAVLEVKFPANIDIRDSVKYKSIMKSYKLGKYWRDMSLVYYGKMSKVIITKCVFIGPNGAILTCLNIFAA